MTCEIIAKKEQRNGLHEFVMSSWKAGKRVITKMGRQNA